MECLYLAAVGDDKCYLAADDGWPVDLCAGSRAANTLVDGGAVISLIPILIIYFITQKQFTEGIATTGLKG